MKRIYHKAKSKLQEKSPRLYKHIDKRKLYIKYFIAGTTAAFVNLSVLYFLTDILGFWYIFSTTISFIFAFFVSFYLQKFWTFRDNNREKERKQATIYLLVNIGNLFLNAAGMYLLVEAFHMWYILAQIITGIFIAMSSFVIYRFIIFKKPKEKEGKAKNILIATGIYPPDIGGPATYVQILYDELPKKGFNVKIVTYSDDESSVFNYQSSIIKVCRDQNILFRYLKYFWYIFKLINWADTIYVQGPISEGLPTCLACKLRQKDFILKIVGDYAWEQGRQRFGVEELLDDFQERKYSWRVELMRKIQKRVARRAKQIITPSKYLKSIVSKWGVKEEKIKVIYNALEFKNVQAKEREKKKRIVSVGRLVEWKGMDTLIDIMPEIWKDIDAELILIGDGPERKRLEKKISDKRIKLLGSLSHEETLAYIKSADVFVLNSGYEGLSHVLLEAASFGVPILASNIGGNPELVTERRIGDLFEYNNKGEIINSIKKYLLHEQIINADIDSFRKIFSLKNNLSKLVEIL